jgi:hypothetical protein
MTKGAGAKSYMTENSPRFSLFFPPCMKRTFEWGGFLSISINYYKIIILLRKALPESISITTHVIISSVH